MIPYILSFIIIILLFFQTTLILKQINLWASFTIKINEMDNYIKMLIDSNKDAEIILKTNKLIGNIKILKKQNSKRWWIELRGKEDIFNKMKFSLSFSEEYKNIQVYDHESFDCKNNISDKYIFIGFEPDKIITIAKALTKSIFDLTGSDTIHLTTKKMIAKNKPDDY